MISTALSIRSGGLAGSPFKTLAFTVACVIGPGLVRGDDPAPAANAPKPISPAAQAISRVLQAETTPGKGSVETIEPLYRQALDQAPRDARLEYAYSLVLLRLFEPVKAREHLTRALELDPEYLPANQAVIRELLKSRKFPEAGEQLSALAQSLDPASPAAPHAAEWLGRIVGAVISALGTPDAQSQFAYHDRLFRTSLPPVLLSSYEKGFLSVDRDLEQLKASIDDARSSSEVKREAEKARVDAELKIDQNEIKLKQQEAARTREKWDEWITDQTSKADDVLREQEKRYQDLENAVTTQLQSVTALRLAIERTANFAIQQQQRNVGISPLAFSQPNIDAMTVQLAIEERRLAVLYDQQSGVSQQAAQTLAARRNAVARYQQATGIAFKDAANLDRWEKRNKTVAENMKKAAEKKPSLVAALEARVRMLSTWDPADFDSEKRRLLDDLGIEQEPALKAVVP